jgi:hypothetical protein
MNSTSIGKIVESGWTVDILTRSQLEASHRHHRPLLLGSRHPCHCRLVVAMVPKLIQLVPTRAFVLSWLPLDGFQRTPRPKISNFEIYVLRPSSSQLDEPLLRYWRKTVIFVLFRNVPKRAFAISRLPLGRFSMFQRQWIARTLAYMSACFRVRQNPGTM